MEQVTIRRLKAGTLASFKALAKANGRSLEAELRDLIESNMPLLPKDPEYLRALSMRLMEGMPLGSDSTRVIREGRDTGWGKYPAIDDVSPHAGD